jgi:uncharacterized protein YdaU (DUF1376 family)
MAKDPAFLFYPNDYIGGTMGLTFEEKGAYMELLMMQFNRGHMTKDMIGRVVGHLWDVLEDKFEKDENGLYFNRRLEEEQNKRKRFTDSRRNNKKGVNQHSKQPGHMTSHMEDENENEDENESIIGFNIFWDLYDKKVGSKSKIKKKWDKLSTKTQQLILDYIPKYKIAQPEKKYRKNPETFFNNEGWLDEIIDNNGNNKSNIQQGNGHDFSIVE